MRFLCTQTHQALGYFTDPFSPEIIPLCNTFSIPFTRSTTTPFDINMYEVEAIKFALQTWGPIWSSSKATVFIGDKSSELGLVK
jgi:hypothetical protein